MATTLTPPPDWSINATEGGDLDGFPGGHGRLHAVLWKYVAPFIFALGLAGNVLIMCVMRRMRMRGTTATIYLPLMAFFDNLVLVTGIVPEWLESADIVIIKETHPVSCKLEKFLFYSTSDTAIWLLVLFTVDRFVAVCFPLRKFTLCRPQRAIVASVCVLCLCIGKNLHVFWTRGYQEVPLDGVLYIKNCGRPNSEYFEQFVRPWIAFVFISAVPFLVILSCNVCIVYKLLTMKQVGHVANTASIRLSSRRNSRMVSQATILCMAVSFTFLVTISPSIVLLIGKPYWTVDDPTAAENQTYADAKAVSNVLGYLNHSLNFLLYCCTGRAFRRELMDMCRCRHSGIDERAMGSKY